MQPFVAQISTFSTILLGIFIEATPFLLMGTVASGLVEVFVASDDLARLLPRNLLASAVVGGLLGFAFPVCECGVIPLTRRFFRKGLPPSSGIAFLLAAPILNPIVLASTYAAYGWGNVLVARFALGLLVSVGVGLIFALHPDAKDIVKVIVRSHEHHDEPQPVLEHSQKLSARLRSALVIAGDEFFEMGKYLVIGASLAALLQTFIPQTVIRTFGASPFLSVFVMLGLAYVLSVCSTVDAFLSLAFVKLFPTGSIIAFLVFGPMADIKSTLMLARVFRGRYVIYLIMMPLLLTGLSAILINTYLRW